MRAVSVFNVLFLCGLLLSVRVLMSGVKRADDSVAAVVRTRWAMLAGSLTLTGFVGSVLWRLGGSSFVRASALVASVLVGAASARWLARRAAAMTVSDRGEWRK